MFAMIIYIFELKKNKKNGRHSNIVCVCVHVFVWLLCSRSILEKTRQYQPEEK